MNSVLNPTVPFNILIPGGVQPGKMIKLQGFSPYVSNRFSVNLICGPMGDVAFHVSPMFDRKCVVRNSIKNMQMGYEESFGGMPLQQGQNFEFIILCDHQNFKIAFNGQHFAEFNHRLPFNSITNLAVDGQVVIFSVNFEENTSRNIGMVIPPNPSPTHAQPMPPYPTGNSAGLMYPTNNNVPNYSGSPYPHNNPVYPPQSGYGNQNLYPQIPVNQTGNYPPSQPVNGSYPHSTQGFPHSPKPHKSSNLLDKAGMAVAGVLGTSALLGGSKKKLGALGDKLGVAVATATALSNHLNPKKAMKKQMKAHKKALKYGLPLAGAGLGAYALHKGFHGFRRSSSSSSSSSD